MNKLKRKVIVVTDGDSIAKKVVEKSALSVCGRCLSISWGNPTKITGEEMVRLIKCVKFDPVIVMADDRGNIGRGNGEKAINFLIKCEEVEVIGIVAVASNTKNASGIKVRYSVDKNCKQVKGAVDKYGDLQNTNVLKGDTVNTINLSSKVCVVGIGDPGKVEQGNDIENEDRILSKALKIIMEEDKKNR